MTRSKLLVMLLLVIVSLIAMPFLWRQSMKDRYESQIVTLTETPKRPAAVVFGAAVLRNGRLSSVLRDRMDKAIELYHSGLVDTLLLSGDQRSEYYDEPGAMRTYAELNGVLSEDIVIDPAGLRTYDTCYRVKSVYSLESAVLVSQEFHLPRALYTCQELGISAVGVAADSREYRAANWYEFRETFASMIALWDVFRDRPPAALGIN